MAHFKAGSTYSRNSDSKTVFVTGGAGRVGRCLVRSLVEKGYTVRTLSETKDFMGRMPSGVIPYVGDINDRKMLDEAFDGVDTVFHLAAIVSEHRASTRDIMRVNVKGTANVVEASISNKVPHIIFSSSVDVYGKDREDVLTEESRLAPTDKYGHSKALAEKEIERHSGKIRYTIMRTSAIYGSEFAASYFKMFRAVKEGKAYIIGNGSNHLSLVHIDDVVSAYMLAMESGTGTSGIYNISDGVAYTQEQLLDLIADMLKVERPARHISPLVVKLLAKRRNLDSDELRFIMSNRLVDISKARRELGFKPKVDIAKGGAALIEEFLAKMK